MAAFTSFQQYHPFLPDSLLLPSPNTSAINTPYNFKFNDDQQPAPNTGFNSLCDNANSLYQEPLLNELNEVDSQDGERSPVKNQSTTPESSAVADQTTDAVYTRRRKTRKGSSNCKEEREGGKSKRLKKGMGNEEKDKKSSEEPPKDYIHVRARRGQATDSHSLAERVRREKISERMRCLQKLVPGCDKVTGKALMLDEIINYVQSLQNQVEFLSMKLASMSPVVYDFGLDLDSFIVRSEMGPTEASTAFTTEAMPTTTPMFPPLLDNSSLSPQPPLSLGNNSNDNEEEPRQKFLNTSGFTNTSFCSFP